jgi:hypothetical protein
MPTYRAARPRWHALSAELLALLIVGSALAAQPITGTFIGRLPTHGQEITFTTPDRASDRHWAGVLQLQLDRDTPGDRGGQLAQVFCIQVTIAVRTSDRYINDGTVTGLRGGCAIRYLLGKYPASDLPSPAEAAARQLAIWHFSDQIDLATVREASIRQRAIELAGEAQLATLAGCPATVPEVTAFRIEPQAASAPIGRPTLFTVRVEPAGAAQRATVRVDGPAVIGDDQREVSLPLRQGAATFSVTSQAAGRAIITAELPGQIDAGLVFSPIDQRNPTQRLVLAAPLSIQAQAALDTLQATASPGPADTPPPAGTPTPSNTPTPANVPVPTDTPSATPTAPASTPSATFAPTPTGTSPDTPTHTPTTGAPRPTGTPPAITATAPISSTGPLATPEASAPTALLVPASLPLTTASGPAGIPALIVLALLLAGGGVALLAGRVRK